METNELLQQRSSVHGKAYKQFLIAQKLKNTFRDDLNNASFNNINENLYMIRESLDMIAVKLSRIFTGVGDYQDHWDDIAGYAKIVANHIARNEEENVKRKENK